MYLLRVGALFRWWQSGGQFATLEAKRYIGHRVIKTTTFILLALIPLYSKIATVFSFFWINPVAFLICIKTH